MSETLLQPQIIPVDRESTSYLKALTISDARPFGDALEALGVDEADLDTWHIYTAPSSEAPHEPKTVIIDPDDISRRIRADVGDSRKGNFRFSGEFKAYAAAAIFSKLAAGVVKTGLPENVFLDKHGNARLWPGLSVMLGGTVGFGLENGNNAIPEIAISLLGGIAVMKVSRDFYNPFTASRRLQAKALEKSPDLLKNIQDAVWPVYREMS
jgi:hypothetical protein